MMKLPTKSATPANTSRMMLKKLSWFCTAAAELFACSARVLTSKLAPIACRTRCCSSRSLTPFAVAMLMLLKPPGFPSRRWAVTVSKAVREAPASPPLLPNRKTPTRRASTRGPGVSSGTVSPIR